MIWSFFSTFFAGRIGFYVNNGFEELFLQNCKESKLELYNLTSVNGILYAQVRYSDKEKIFTIAKNSGMELHIESRKGLPELIFRYRKRFGIPIGMLLFCVITAFLSCMVWSIDISDTEFIKEEEIIDVLNELGIVKGVFTDSIQTNDAELFIRKRFEKLAWIELNIVGSRVFVSVIERDPAEEKASGCADIIAAKDGEVIRADILTGEGKILPGTPVVKGDVLVNGITSDENGNVRYYDAEAHIWARTRNILNTSAAKSIDVYRVSACKDKYLVYVFGMNVPLFGRVKQKDFTEHCSYLSAGDVVFPIGMIRQNVTELKREKISITEEQARLIAFFDFSRASENYYKNTSVLERTISVTCDNQVSFTGNYLCIEDIALKKEITVTD